MQKHPRIGASPRLYEGRVSRRVALLGVLALAGCGGAELPPR